MVKNIPATELWKEKVKEGKYSDLEDWVYALDPKMAKFSGYSNFLLTGSHTSSSFPISP